MEIIPQNTERLNSSPNKSQSLVFNLSGSSLLSPNASELATGIAIILQSQLQEDQIRHKRILPKSPFFIFSEDKYIPKKKDMTSEQIKALHEIPTVGDMQEFIYNLYDCGQFSPECIITSLIYINRVILAQGLPFLNTTWRPIILCSMLVAQKVLDDNCLSNSDFAYMYPFFEVEDINKLEEAFLVLIEFNVTVKLPLYLRYYYDLRTLTLDAEQEANKIPEPEVENQIGTRLDNISKNFKQNFPDQKLSVLLNDDSTLNFSRSMGNVIPK